MTNRRHVGEVMKRTVLTVKPETPFKAIAVLLASWGVSGAPVVDDDGRVLGVVSQNDLLERTTHHRLLRLRPRLKRKVHGQCAAELMTKPAVTIWQGAEVSEAVRRLESHRIHRLPVVDEEGRLTGIVGRSELLRGFLRLDDEVKAEIAEQVIRRSMTIDPATMSVAVRDGVVTMNGQVERTSMIPVLVSLVRKVDGVVDVRERLTAGLDDTNIKPEEPVNKGILAR